jgi:hypothetical protein
MAITAITIRYQHPALIYPLQLEQLENEINHKSINNLMFFCMIFIFMLNVKIKLLYSSYAHRLDNFIDCYKIK